MAEIVANYKELIVCAVMCGAVVLVIDVLVYLKWGK